MSRTKLMGKKIGMTQVFDQTGRAIACTVIQCEPNVITQVKTKETDGYDAIQLGHRVITVKDPRTLERRTTKPQRGHFAKANIEVRKNLAEQRVASTDGKNVGDAIAVTAFEVGQLVDVTGTSKGKGYQGVMKKYGFAGGPGGHGSKFHRHAGSTGMRSTPGRCLPGGPRPSHMGDKRRTVQNCQIVQIHADDNLILVKGQVPGANNGLVTLMTAVKQS